MSLLFVELRRVILRLMRRVQHLSMVEWHLLVLQEALVYDELQRVPQGFSCSKR